MPSSYSPDLRIELIANGEQSGSWGDTTNTNLGTLIEDAISGLASVSVISANQALTALNGVADEARCAAIALTTTTGANFNIYVPPVTKLYVVRNASAYTATVYCSTVLGNTTAAGAGVAIPAGKSILIRSDGTNITEQFNHVVNNFSTSGNLTVGGTLTATSPVFSGTPTAPTASLGTNTTQLATTEFVINNSNPTGGLMMWPTASAPTGWLLCNGAAVSRSTYAALFAVIGTVFGSGNGSTTFNLPDYRDRMPIGANSIASIAGTGGSKDAIVVSHTHTATSVVTDPGHNHSGNGYAGKGASTSSRLAIGDTNSVYGEMPVNAATGVTVATSISSTGSSGTNANLPPYLGINFIIKT